MLTIEDNEDFAVRKLYVDPDRLFNVLLTYPNILDKCVFVPTVNPVALNRRPIDQNTASRREETIILALQPFIRCYGRMPGD